MKIFTINSISFGYKSILKTHWLKGNMPSVKYDMAGNLLTKKNCTLGHMQPHSKGGKTRLDNLMLETKAYNMSKGNMPFSKFFNWNGFYNYCEQFRGIVLDGFNGEEYIKGIIKTVKRLLKQRK